MSGDLQRLIPHFPPMNLPPSQAVTWLWLMQALPRAFASKHSRLALTVVSSQSPGEPGAPLWSLQIKLLTFPAFVERLET